MRPRQSTSFLGWILLWTSACYGATVEQLFDVKYDSSAGSCAWVRKSNHRMLDTILREASELSGLGSDLVSSAEFDVKAAERLVVAMFLDPDELGPDKKIPAEILKEIKANYEAVEKWIDDGGDTFGGSASGTPLLKCQDGFRKQVADSDYYLDMKGNKIPDGKGSFKTIRDMLGKDIEKQSQQFKLWFENGRTKTLETAVAYRIDELMGYDLDASYRGEYLSCSEGYGRMGSVFIDQTDAAKDAKDAKDVRAILMMCPAAFGTGNTSPNLDHVPELGDIEVEPKTLKELIEAKEKGLLKDLQPLMYLETPAVTLLHELLHLVLGKKMSPPNGEVYDTAKILGLRSKEALRNPESYAQAALAWRYTQESLAEDPDNPIEFTTGFAIQG